MFLSVICLSLASTCILVVSRIALHFSELKTVKRTGDPFQADLNYEKWQNEILRHTGMFEDLFKDHFQM